MFKSNQGKSIVFFMCNLRKLPLLSCFVSSLQKVSQTAQPVSLTCPSNASGSRGRGNCTGPPGGEAPPHQGPAFFPSLEGQRAQPDDLCQGSTKCLLSASCPLVSLGGPAVVTPSLRWWHRHTWLLYPDEVGPAGSLGPQRAVCSP